MFEQKQIGKLGQGFGEKNGMLVSLIGRCHSGFLSLSILGMRSPGLFPVVREKKERSASLTALNVAKPQNRVFPPPDQFPSVFFVTLDVTH